MQAASRLSFTKKCYLGCKKKNASNIMAHRRGLILCQRLGIVGLATIILLLGNFYISHRLLKNESESLFSREWDPTLLASFPRGDAVSSISPCRSLWLDNDKPTLEPTAASLFQRHVRIRAVLLTEPNGSSSAIFVLCKDSLDHIAAYQRFDSVSWAHVYTIPPSTDWGFFHFYNFIGHIMEISSSQNLYNNTRFHWVGSLDYASLDTSVIPALLKSDVFTHSFIRQDIHVLSFSQRKLDNIRNMSHRVAQMEESYPGFIPMMEHLLVMAGEGRQIVQSVINCTNATKCRFIKVNQFATRPELFRSFITWLTRIMILACFDHKAVEWFEESLRRSRLLQNSTEANNNSALYSIIGDILASFFFNTRGATIITLDDFVNATFSSNQLMITASETHNLTENNRLSTSIVAFEERIKSRRDYYFNIRNPDSTPFIFIICPDEKSSAGATEVYSPYSWANTYILPPSRIGDYFFVTNHLGESLHLATTNTHWIGFLPWNDAKTFNLTLIDQMLGDKILVDDGVDVLVFDASSSESLSSTKQTLSNMTIEKLEYILLSTGESSKERDWLNIHDYYFAANLDHIRSFIPWISRILLFAESHEKTREDPIEWSFCTKYLASYYFTTRGNKIVSTSDYETILESREKVQTQTDRYIEHNSNMILSLKNETDGTPMVFVLSHDQDSLDFAKQSYASYHWAHIYVLYSTYMFETYFYTNILESLMDAANHTTDWVGSISYRADEKTYRSSIDNMLNDKTLVRDGYDVLGFWAPISLGDSVKEHSRWYHPGLMEIMDYALLSVGETQENVTRMGDPSHIFKAFYGTYFVCRPVLMRQYISWLTRVVIFINTDVKAQKMLWKNSHYFGSASEKLFNLPYYPLHPFVGERLSIYFFNTRGAKIALMNPDDGSYPWKF